MMAIKFMNLHPCKKQTLFKQHIHITLCSMALGFMNRRQGDDKTINY